MVHFAYLSELEPYKPVSAPHHGGPPKQQKKTTSSKKTIKNYGTASGYPVYDQQQQSSGAPIPNKGRVMQAERAPRNADDPPRGVDTPRTLQEEELLNFLLHTSTCIFLIVFVDILLSPR